jgi:hypothetical protein
MNIYRNVDKIKAAASSRFELARGARALSCRSRGHNTIARVATTTMMGEMALLQR